MFSSGCRRGILALAAGGGNSPLTAFAGGKKGLWWDPSDITTGFTDSAGTTPQTASGDPTGKRSDKSGNANHMLQATATARPIYTVASAIASDLEDGVDDNGATNAFVAGTLTTAMDCFVTLKRTAAVNQLVAHDGTAGTFFGVMESGAGTLTTALTGAAWTCWVDGVQIGGTGTTTRDQLHLAMTTGVYHVLEFRDLDLSAWVKFFAGGYSAYQLGANVAQLILCESQSSLRNSLRTFAGAKGGLSL